MLVDGAAALLLAWYDVSARRLPWRAPPGTPPPDPYRVWLSEVMLQQTTVAAARAYFERFTSRWPTVEALAAARDEDVMTAWAGLGYYARARNLIACARAVAAIGRFPDTEQALLALPGIGRYTAAAVAAIAFGRRTVVVDANVERVVARLFAVAEPLPSARPRLYALTDSITPRDRAGDFAQAMMDLGATICTPRRPACGICPLRRHCAAAASNSQECYPVKPAKAAKPQRYGIAWWIEREGRVALVRRPARGLLGGMRALPTSDWTSERPAIDPGAALLGTVGHVFTHFALELVVAASDDFAASDAEWWSIEGIDDAGLPTVFAKAAALGRAREIA